MGKEILHVIIGSFEYPATQQEIDDAEKKVTAALEKAGDEAIVLATDDKVRVERIEYPSKSSAKTSEIINLYISSIITKEEARKMLGL